MAKNDLTHPMFQPRSFLYKKTMWRSISIMMTILVSILFHSCNKDKDVSEDFEPEPPLSGIAPSELKGTWTINDGTDFYFIYFDGINEYSMCLNDRIMGCGSYSINNNQLILKNQYLKRIDEVSISMTNGKINIHGCIISFNNTGAEDINITLLKSSETPPTSIVGKVWHSGMILAKPTDYKEYLEFVSDYTAKFYRIRDNYKNEKFNEYYLYYIYRNGFVYTQRVDGDGSVNIYKLNFNVSFTLGNSLSENKVN